MLLHLGILTGLRVSDILRLKVKHIQHPSFSIVEKKTKKKKHLYIDDAFYAYFMVYIADNQLSDNDYVIFSTKKHKDTPLSRVQAYRVLNRAGLDAGLPAVGTHTMRKTFAVEHFRIHRDIEALQKLLNHKYIHTTMMYLWDIEDINALAPVPASANTGPAAVSAAAPPAAVPVVAPAPASASLRARCVRIISAVVDFVLDIFMASRRR